jgi:hypothetical protein
MEEAGRDTRVKTGKDREEEFEFRFLLGELKWRQNRK